MEHPTKSLRTIPGEQTLTPRLLLVEDEASLARVISRVLTQAGFDVTHAPDGAVAAEALTTKSFDVVLSDITLPGATGVDLLRLVRVYDLDVPVILMTGNPTIETATQAVELGALQYLAKPVPLDQLQAAVGRALTLGQLARAKREALETVNEGTHHQIGDRAGLSVRFDRAVEGLRLAFQPIIDARQRKIVAYEMLLRSSEPSLPDPGAVLDAAERLDAVHHLGRHIRLLASRAFRLLPSPDMSLFVNLHAHELTDPDLYAGDAPLGEFARRVVLEITERASLESLSDITSRARRLRDLGYRIAVDDLGAGYAGLTTFTTLEPEVVKLDMSLVRNIGQSATKQRVVQSMIRLCREMSMRVVAEGIETREELACIGDLGCDLLQGYYLGKPADSPAATPLV